jgi:hypothetical protein
MIIAPLLQAHGSTVALYGGVSRLPFGVVAETDCIIPAASHVLNESLMSLEKD